MRKIITWAFLAIALALIIIACGQKETQQNQGSSIQQNTQDSAIKNNNDFVGLISAAQTCTPYRASVVIRQNLGGVINTFTEQAQILGYTNQYCHFSSKRINVEATIDQELANYYLESGQMTQAQLDAYNQSLQQQTLELKKNNIGLIQDCNFPSNDIVNFLKSWQNGSTSENQDFFKYCKFTLPNQSS